MRKSKLAYLMILLVLSLIPFFVKTNSSYIASGNITFRAYTFDVGANHYISISTSWSGDYFLANYLTVDDKTYAVTGGFASIPRTTVFTVDGMTYTYRDVVSNDGWWVLGVIGIVLFFLSLRYDGAVLLFAVVAAFSAGLLIQGVAGANNFDVMAYMNGPNVVAFHSVTRGYVQLDEGAVRVMGFSVSSPVFRVTGYFDGVYMVKSVGTVGALTVPAVLSSDGSVYYFTSVPRAITVDGEEYTYAGRMTLGWGWVVEVFSMPVNTAGLFFAFFLALTLLFPLAPVAMGDE